MKGWTIFTKSLRLVVGNLGDALRVSLVLYSVQVLNQIYASRAAARFDPTNPGDVSVSALGNSLLLGLAAIVASLWIAVGWHRYVLNEEYPTGWLPRWHGSEMLAYLGRSLMIGILIVLAAVAAGLVVALLGTLSSALGSLGLLGLIGLAGYLFFRLGVMLPAAAIGTRMTLAEAWAATRDDGGAVLVLAAIVIGASLLIQAPAFIGADAGSPLTLVYTLVTGWFVTVVGISVLTTLYGHYVEGRAID